MQKSLWDRLVWIVYSEYMLKPIKIMTVHGVFLAEHSSVVAMFRSYWLRCTISFGASGAASLSRTYMERQPSLSSSFLLLSQSMVVEILHSLTCPSPGIQPHTHYHAAVLFSTLPRLNRSIDGCASRGRLHVIRRDALAMGAGKSNQLSSWTRSCGHRRPP